jgi:TM2 domain-containing membrane protein YozV
MAMTTELLIALGIPLAYLLISTGILLKGDLELPRFVQRLNSRDALLWNTMVAITITIGTMRWALSR